MLGAEPWLDGLDHGERRGHLHGIQGGGCAARVMRRPQVAGAQGGDDVGSAGDLDEPDAIKLDGRGGVVGDLAPGVECGAGGGLEGSAGPVDDLRLALVHGIAAGHGKPTAQPVRVCALDA